MPYPELMLDVGTLRIAQAAVALCALVLIYFGTYRSTRAPFAAWWSGVVAASAVGTGFYLLANDSTRHVMGALGNGIAVSAVSFGWAASRSLRGQGTRWWQTVVPGAVAFVASLIERPTGAQWPSGAALLVGMFVVLVMTAVELWRVVAERHTTPNSPISPDAWSAIIAISIASTAGAMFYGVRLTAYLTVGADSPLYVDWLGPALTTLGVALMLMVVTYSVAELSRYEIAHHWKIRANHDDLTGLLNRTAFGEQARAVLEAGDGTATVMLADFDQFKAMNDDYGHAMGDRALVAFGAACAHVLDEGDLAGRLGGDEFVILLADGGVERAGEVSRRLAEEFAHTLVGDDVRPTVSFGVAPVAGTSLESAMGEADKALYQAKGSGRRGSTFLR